MKRIFVILAVCSAFVQLQAVQMKTLKQADMVYLAELQDPSICKVEDTYYLNAEHVFVANNQMYLNTEVYGIMKVSYIDEDSLDSSYKCNKCERDQMQKQKECENIIVKPDGKKEKCGSTEFTEELFSTNPTTQAMINKEKEKQTKKESNKK